MFFCEFSVIEFFVFDTQTKITPFSNRDEDMTVGEQETGQSSDSLPSCSYTNVHVCWLSSIWNMLSIIQGSW